MENRLYQILSHSGSKEQTLFEVKWKAGDVTWLPYNQVSDLPAFGTYLDLVGTDNISSLSKNTGVPLTNGLQVHLGLLTFASPKFYKILTGFWVIPT